MKQNQITSLPKLDRECFENLFNVYQTSDKMYYYNLLQTIVFPDNLPASLFKNYNVVYGDTWPFISFKNYNTPNLWWIILIANKIMDPTKQPKTSESIKIPIMDVVQEILTQISK